MLFRSPPGCASGTRAELGPPGPLLTTPHPHPPTLPPLALQVRDMLTTTHEQQLLRAGGQTSPTLRRDAVLVDAVVNTVGFPLVGGPAGELVFPLSVSPCLFLWLRASLSGPRPLCVVWRVEWGGGLGVSPGRARSGVAGKHWGAPVCM